METEIKIWFMNYYDEYETKEWYKWYCKTERWAAKRKKWHEKCTHTYGMIVVGLENLVENAKDKFFNRIRSCSRKCSIWIRIHFSEVPQRVLFNIWLLLGIANELNILFVLLYAFIWTPSYSHADCMCPFRICGMDEKGWNLFDNTMWNVDKMSTKLNTKMPQVKITYFPFHSPFYVV